MLAEFGFKLVDEAEDVDEAQDCVVNYLRSPVFVGCVEHLKL